MEPLSYSSANDLVTELTSLLSADKGGPIGNFVEVIPNQRLNAVLIASKRPAYLSEIQNWIRRLDVGADPAVRRLYIHHVQNGRAVDLAPILNELFGTTGAPSPAEQVTAPGEQQATLLSPSLFEETAQQPQSVITPPPPEPTAQNNGTQSGYGGTVLADDTRNALLIRATPPEFRVIKDAILHLDTKPLQVLIEATIAEVTLNDELQYGVEFFLSSGNNSVTLSDISTGAVASNFPGFSYLFSGSARNQVILNALSAVTDVRVVSSPHLMVVDNKTARLQVGDQVPVATQSSVSNIDATAPTVNTIEFRDTGIVLEVTPRVSLGGTITLDISQEVSDVVSTTTSGIDSPTIQQRKISSHVVVQSGNSLVLGGLIRDRQTETDTGIPVLSGIPVLGSLFGASDNNHSRTELLILITPRVVRNEIDANRVTEEFKRRFRALEGAKDDETTEAG